MGQLGKRFWMMRITLLLFIINYDNIIIVTAAMSEFFFFLNTRYENEMILLVQFY